jgi:hypothetical protein
MPEAAHRGLIKSARKKHLTGENFDRYVYGGLANLKKKEEAKNKRRTKKAAKP